MKERFTLKKINSYIFAKIITIFILTREIGFFSIPWVIKIYPFHISYYVKKDICIYIGVIFVFLLLKYKKKFIEIKEKRYYIICLAWIGMIGLTFIMSLVAYKNESFYMLFKKYYFYEIIAVFFILVFLFRKYKDYYSFFLKSIVYIGTMYALFIIIYKIVYEITGLYIFDINYQLIQVRRNTLRLARPADFISLSCILSFSFILKQKANKKWVSCFVISLIGVFWVTQTRIYQLAIIISCIIGWLFYTRSGFIPLIKKYWWVGVIVISPILIKFIYSFFASEDLGGTLVRVEGYIYFLQNIVKNGVIGIGFLANQENTYILRGPGLKYSLTDLGIVGFIGIFGILGIIFIGLLLVLFFKSFKNSLKTKSHPEVVILIIYILITSISVIFNDLQRAIYLPIYLSILSYCNEIDNKDWRIYEDKIFKNKCCS
ncbi:hypothetical protein AAK706_05565 [Erysipelotrichaceae bacterium 66-17]|nr:hypothetical protein EROP_12440 [Erysipelotrichaceae bacterium OPF54]